MNNIAALEQNNLIENIPEENFAKKVFNRVVCIVKAKRMDIACNLTLSFIGSTTGLAYWVNAKQPSYNESLDFFIELLITTNIVSMVTITSLNFLFPEIQNNPIPQAVAGRRRTPSKDISDILPYNKLQQLPANYQYEKDDICPISYEKLTQGDTVCCDKKLYSYLALKDSYIRCFKLIPHSLKLLKWNENVYKLPEYSSE